MALMTRLWGHRRAPTTAELLRRADRLRRAGRPAEALALVTDGLALEPASVTGHLLAAYLHLAGRTLEPAKAEFRWVLARDPHHARALLGLARIALEEGELAACRESLQRALRFYPDFPEAAALLEAVSARRRGPAPPAAPPVRPADLGRLRLPAPARALLVLRGDSVLVARPEGDADGAGLGHVVALAGAMLGRAGCSALRRFVVDDESDARFTRIEGDLVLSLVLPRATEISHGLLEVNRLWAGTLHELGMTAAAPAPGITVTPAPAARASDRRAS